MKHLKYFNESQEFDDELIRDYLNDFELDYDLSIDISHDVDEFGKFYSIYFNLDKLTTKMISDLKNSIRRICDQENLEFESAVVGGKGYESIEDIGEFYKELSGWVKLKMWPDHIEIILKSKD